MARKPQQNRAQEKARKQKILLAVLGVVFVGLLAFQGPKTLKMLKGTPNAPVVEAAATTTTAASSTTAVTPTATPAAPVVAVPSSALVSAVEPTVDTGQLREFSKFASKDPFASQASTPSASSSSPSTPSTSTPPASAPPSAPPALPPAPPSPPPTSAIISLNGELMSVSLNMDFPTSGTVYSRVGSLFHLVSLTKTTAKVTIVGGSYANGVPALTLTLGKPVTLQNTADGTRYTLVLEPPGTQLPASTTSTPTSTTPGSSVVPTGP